MTVGKGGGTLLPPMGNPEHFSAKKKSRFPDTSGKVSSVIREEDCTQTIFPIQSVT